MTAFVHHFSFEFRAGVRNRSLLLLNYLFPIGFYLLAGTLMTSLNPSFKEYLIPAMVFFTILTSTLLGLPDPIVSARESGIFRSYKIHGIPELAILIIPALTTILHTIVVAVLIVLTAPLLFQAVLPANWLSFVLSFFLMAFASAGIGLLIGVVSPSSRATILLAQALFLPSMMIGGLMFPAHMLPDALRTVALLLPSTHAVNILGGWTPGGIYTFNPYASAAVLYAGGALAFIMALILFNWDKDNPTRHVRPVFALLAFAPYVIAAVLTFVGI